MACLAVSIKNVSQEEGQPADNEGSWDAKKERMWVRSLLTTSLIDENNAYVIAILGPRLRVSHGVSFLFA